MKLNIDFIYPVGSLYMTTSSVSPETLFGGKWTQIINDAYLKIVTTNAGSLGGTSSSHKIPETSMPSHFHYVITGGLGDEDVSYHSDRSLASYSVSPNTDLPYSLRLINSTANCGKTSSVGSGNAYYPYYYGIYLWKRTA